MSRKELAAGQRIAASRTQLAAALCAAGFGLGPGAVWAQAADTATTMDTVVVTASGFEQRIQDAEKALARQAEHRVRAVPEQRIHHDLAAVANRKISMHEKPYPRGFRRGRLKGG